MPRGQARPADTPLSFPAGDAAIGLIEWSDFVGRAGPLHAIADAYHRGARLVTLCGPAGIGKTRLARHFASLDPTGRESARFVDLTACRSGSDFQRKLGQALGAGGRRRTDGGVRQSTEEEILFDSRRALVVDELSDR